MSVNTDGTTGAQTDELLREARKQAESGEITVDSPDLPVSTWLVRSVLWHAQTGQSDTRVAEHPHELEVSQTVTLENGDGEYLATAWIQCDTQTAEVFDVVATTDELCDCVGLRDGVCWLCLRDGAEFED